jgi:CIC family chloride channel protein
MKLAIGATHAIIHTVFFGVIIGLISAIGSHYFRSGIATVNSFIDENLSQFTLFIGFFISLSVAAFAVYLLQKYGNLKKFDGPADSIYAAHRLDNELNVKAGILSTLAAFFSAAGGASVGQYGPIVHFGATIGSWLKEKFATPITADIFIGCGVAGAISSGFGAPIAGVIFAHEAVTRHFSVKAIAPIAVSSGIAFIFTEYLWGTNAPLEQMTLPSSTSFNLTVIATLFIAPLFGVFAVIFMLTLEKLILINKKINMGRFWKTTIAVTALSFIGSNLPQVMGLGTEVILKILDGDFGLWFLILILFGKLFATTVSLSFGFFGGVFSPALFLGAAFGAIFAQILTNVGLDNLSYSVISICGMASVAGAVIGAPLTAVLIVFELTQSYSLGLAALVSVVLAVLVSEKFYGHSYFDKQLLSRGINLSNGRAGLLTMDRKVAEFTSDAATLLEPKCSLGEAKAIMAHNKNSEAYVVDDKKMFLGKVEFMKIVDQNNSLPITQFANLETVTLMHDASLQQAIEIAADFVGESIPIINETTFQFHGTVTEGDIFTAYLEIQGQITDLEKK